MTPDITELTIEERQNALWGMTPSQLRDVLKKQMADCRQTEIQARLDTLTVLILQTLAPAEDIEEESEEYEPCSPELAELIKERIAAGNDIHRSENADLLRRLKAYGAKHFNGPCSPDDAEDTDRYCGPI